MSKRPRRHEQHEPPDSESEERLDAEALIQLPLPQHQINLPYHEISSELNVGFDPASVLPSVTPSAQTVCHQPHPHFDSPTNDLPFGCVETTSLQLGMAHATTSKFPDFIPLPVPQDVGPETLETPKTLEPDFPAPTQSALSMDLDAISLAPPSVDLGDSTLAIETSTESLAFPTSPNLPDDPKEAVGTQEDSELPFYDSSEYFASDSYGSFFEQEDPVHQFQEDISDSLPGFYETEQFNEFETSKPTSSDQDHQPGADVPLYEGATVTVHDAATALLSFLLGCKISGVVFSRLLTLLNILLPVNHKLFKSMFTFYKHFEGIKTPLNLTYFCNICCQSLESIDSQCSTCKSQTKVGYYIHVPLTEQLKRLYARPGFADLLAYRYHRPRQNSNNYEDIYDGEIYKNNGPLGPLDITCMWNTDGLSLYKSSSFQVWPFYFSINELSPHLRYKEENILLGGIAFGYEKPHPNILLKPIFEEVKLLRTEGIDVTLPNSTSSVNIKCNVICGSCDAPAKAIFMRMSQFNGHFGCHLCLAKGEKSDRTGKVFVYPFERNLCPRSSEQYKVDVAGQGHGIKGPTYLFYMVWSFFLTSTAVDVMHCVYLGICRQIFQLYLSSEYIKLVFGENVDKKSLTKSLTDPLETSNMLIT
ncbi:Mitochondrial group I intron splicing factor CCM1 [Frankliniella fusca]|uniref:Mitochondrial group I intron splicing factor CCM1 n=1 Tax=Frankliniella fusca TaxID=407009 RepID=A0AAE1GQB1_9NEOP|nr:Mitochondrial group I intron splicing factor CCM1 [Frankliniella fusca]